MRACWLYFKAPHSYTGEDVIELQGHGGNVVPQRVLSAVLKIRGVRQAEPGVYPPCLFKWPYGPYCGRGC